MSHPKEQWKAVSGRPYEVSTMGRIRKVTESGYEMRSFRYEPAEYRSVYLGRGDCRALHRVVAETFIGPIPPGFVVNHKNGMPGDNRLENLEIVTKKEDRRHCREVLKSSPPPWSERKQRANLNFKKSIDENDQYQSERWAAKYLGLTTRTVNAWANKFQVFSPVVLNARTYTAVGYERKELDIARDFLKKVPKPSSGPRLTKDLLERLKETVRKARK